MNPRRLVPWPEPPNADPVRAEPSFEREGEILWVAYRTRRRGHFAVLRFDGVRGFAILLGEADEDAPLAHEVTGAPDVPAPLHHWVLAIGGEVYEVTAGEARVIVRAIQAPGAAHAIGSVRA